MTHASPNIASVFRSAAASFAERTALTQDGHSISYRQLLADVEATAAWLSAKSIAAGDKVLVFVPMSVDLYRIVLALFHIGACPVFLDEWVSLGRLRACLETVPCKGLIAGRKLLLLSWIVPALRRIPVRLGSSPPPGDLPAAPVAAVSEDQSALITFTTGSTGTPKAADRTHAFLHAQLAALDPLLREVGSPCLTMLPIVVLLHLARGRTALLPPRKFKAARPDTIRELLRAVAAGRPRSVIASPAAVDRLISSARAMVGAGFEDVTTLLTGGGPVYPDLARRMRDAFAEASITAVYGSTEAEPISHIPAQALSDTAFRTMLKKGLPVGRADPSAQVRILDPERRLGESAALADIEPDLKPAGEPGEIIVSGPHVLKHYINNPTAEAETKILRGQTVWHRTGDYGRLEPDGQLYLLGRVSEVINWQGRELYPSIICYLLKIDARIEISALILAEKGLRLVLEKKDAHRSEAALAALSSLQINGVIVHAVKAIPRDPRHLTKIDYQALRRML